MPSNLCVKEEGSVSAPRHNLGSGGWIRRGRGVGLLTAKEPGLILALLEQNIILLNIVQS